MSEPQPFDTAQAELDSFLAKWRARWPEWAVVEIFVPAGQRAVALAWAALLQELTEAAWGGQDARPGEAKLAWWAEELQGWSAGRRRHPLGRALQREAAPWNALALQLPVLRAARERPADTADAYARLAPFTAAAAAIEAALFSAGAPDPAAPDAIGATLLHARFFHADDAHVPRAVLVRAGEGEPLRIWAHQLRLRWPTDRPSGIPRRLWSRLARARLRRGDPARPLSPWVALWVGWRAARGARRN